MGLFKKGDFPSGYDSPFAKFTSDFYPGTFIEAGKAVGTIASQLDYLPKRQFMTWGRSARSAAAEIGVTVGIPSQWLDATGGNPLGELGALFDIDLNDFRNFDTNSVIGIIEKGAILAFSTVLNSVASSVPMAGGIAQFALFVVQVVREGIVAANADPSRNQVSFTAMAYNKPDDEAQVQNMLSFIHDEQELTNLFMPARIPRGPSDIHAGPGFTDRGPYGVVVSVGGDRPGGPVFAGVPAMTELADAVQYSQGTGGVIDVDERVLDEDVLVGRGSPQTFGEQMPASSQFSATLWQSVIKNSPMAFRIDGWRIADAWEQYYKVLNDWAVHAPASDNARRHRWLMLSRVLSWAHKGTAGTVSSLLDPYFPEPGGAGEGQYPASDCPSGRKCVPKEYVQWRGQQAHSLWADRGPLIRYLIEKQWTQKLLRFLGTLTCAYVPPDAPALRRPVLRQYHVRMRERLLRHDAKYLVDQSMIRDQAYRSKMRTATLGATDQVKVDIGPEKRKQFEDLAIGSIPIIDPELVVDGKVMALVNPTGDSLAIQHVDLPELEGMSGAAVALLAVVIGVPAVWALWRYQRGRRFRWR